MWAGVRGCVGGDPGRPCGAAGQSAEVRDPQRVPSDVA